MMIYEIYNPYIPGLVVHPQQIPQPTRGPLFPASSGRDLPPNEKIKKSHDAEAFGLATSRAWHFSLHCFTVTLTDGTRTPFTPKHPHLRLWKFFPLQAVYNYPTTSGKYFGGEYVFLRCFPPKKIAYKFLFEVIENHAIFRMARLRGRGAENDGKGVRVWWLQNLQWAIIPTCFTKSFRCQKMQESWTFCRLGGEVSTFILSTWNGWW